MKISDAASRFLAYPAWEIYERSFRLVEWRRLERTQWDSAPLRRERQNERLREAVSYAYAMCPFYARRGRAPLVRSAADLALLPILTKDDIRANAGDLISRAYRAEDLFTAKTGGSTGTALRLYFDKRCQEKRNAAALRSDTWAGWRPGEWRGALWGNPPVARTFKQKARAALLDRLVYLDTVEMTERAMDRFRRALIARDVRTLYGHAHSLFVFARFLEEARLPKPAIAAIISTSMMLLPTERAAIERVFECPVTDRYGCEEVGLIASECERHQGLHLNTDHLVVEVVDDTGRPVRPGESGRLLVTDLINRGMPLLRYEVGDVAVPAAHPCDCGRPMPTLERVTGRTADFLVNSDGGLVAGVSLVERTLTAIPGLAQLQIIQDEIDRLRLNVVPDERYTEDTERRLRSEMATVFGQARFDVRLTDRLEQERNGKYRFSICRVPTRYQAVAR